jgi:inosose dehydratase
MTNIKVGTAPVSWGVMEVEGWGGQKAYGEVLAEMMKAGYEGTELGPYGYLPTEPDRLLNELSAHKLQLVSSFVPIPLADAERHEVSYQEAMKVAQLLAQSGARLIVLADEMSEMRRAVAGRVGEQDGMSDEQWQEAVKILARVAEDCRALGLATVFHHHAGTFVETPREIARLLAATDADLIGLCLDTGHYFYGGGDPVEAVQKYGPRIWHLHLKDIRPQVLERVRREGIGFLDAVRQGIFCELGKGAVDFPRIIQGLTSQGYCGWAIFEQDVDASQPGPPPFESAYHSRQYLRNAVGI